MCHDLHFPGPQHKILGFAQSALENKYRVIGALFVDVSDSAGVRALAARRPALQCEIQIIGNRPRLERGEVALGNMKADIEGVPDGENRISSKIQIIDFFPSGGSAAFADERVKLRQLKSRQVLVIEERISLGAALKIGSAGGERRAIGMRGRAILEFSPDVVIDP